VSRPNLYIVKNETPPKSSLESGELASKTGEGSPVSKRRKIDASSIPHEWQMSLPFDEKPTELSIIIVSTETINGETLKKIINDYKPQSAVDLRQLIRFDLPGTSREDIFRTFLSQRTHYIRDSLPWSHLDEIQILKSKSPLSNVLMHEIVKKGANCVLVFVYKRKEVYPIARHLNNIISSKVKTPWRIKEVS
jgi:hypothetical protein